MAYTRGIPGPNDSTAVWQKQEQRNGLVRDDVFGEEHYSFSDSENGGLHKKFTMPDQGGDPTTLADEYGFYVKEDGGVTSIYTREPSSGTVGNIIDDDTFGTAQRIGDFIVGASCSWDVSGNLFNPFNVANITVTDIAPTNNFRTFQLNFTNTLPTNDYFWTLSFFNGANNVNFPFRFKGIFTGADATYGNIVKDSSITFTILRTIQSVTQARNKFTMKVWLIA